MLVKKSRENMLRILCWRKHALTLPRWGSGTWFPSWVISVSGAQDARTSVPSWGAPSSVPAPYSGPAPSPSQTLGLTRGSSLTPSVSSAHGAHLSLGASLFFLAHCLERSFPQSLAWLIFSFSFGFQLKSDLLREAFSDQSTQLLLIISPRSIFIKSVPVESFIIIIIIIIIKLVLFIKCRFYERPCLFRSLMQPQYLEESLVIEDVQ